MRAASGASLKVSYFQKPYRRIIMENFGAQVYASPSNHTHYGSDVLAEDPGEMVQEAMTHLPRVPAKA